MKNGDVTNRSMVGQRYAYVSGGAPMNSGRYLGDSFELAREGATLANKQQWNAAIRKTESALLVIRRGKPYFANRSDVYRDFEERENKLLAMLELYQSSGQVPHHGVQPAVAARVEARAGSAARAAAPLQAPSMPDADTDTFDPTGTRVTSDTQVTWEDISGLEDVKKTLREAIEEPWAWPQLYKGKYCEPWKGVLLYGPPGTGKTMLAKAAATAARCAFFELRSSDLLNKWVGDSEQRVRAIFAEARRHERSIIFVDECDSLFRQRSDRESDVLLRVKTEFFTGMDGLAGSDNIMIIGATNAPGDLDDAMLRRFEKRLMVPVPDFDARVAMFEKAFRSMKEDSYTKADLAALGAATAYYTGADIRIVVKAAIEKARRRIMNSTHFRHDASGEAWPADASTPGAFERPQDTTKLNVNLRIRPQDLDDAIGTNPPAVGAERLKAYNEPFGKKLTSEF